MKKTEKNFEKHLSELETIVEKLEEGKVSIEELVTYYESGMKHLLEAQKILKNAELRLEQLRINATGEKTLEPVELEKET